MCGAVLNRQEDIPEFPDYQLLSIDGNTAEYKESVTGKELSVDYSSLPTQESVYSTLVSFKEKYPEGMEFDNKKSYITEKLFPDIIYEGKGCAGFAFELSDTAFGDLPGRVTFDYSKVRAGDIIRMYEDSHSVIVLKVEGDVVTVAEGNYNRRIHWERTLDLNNADLEWDYMITRYAN